MSESNIIHLTNDSITNESQLNTNLLVHSKLNSFDSHSNNCELSVKLVLSGTERYKINNQRYDLSAKEFLLVDREQELDISFREKSIVEGMCFYIDEKHLQQILSLSEKGGEWGIDNYHNYKKREYNLLSSKYRTGESVFGNYLNQVAQSIKANNELSLSEDFFLDFAHQLLLHQKGVFLSINKLTSLKLSTRKELYCRVMVARDYIEQNIYASNLSIERLANISCLSEVQLHRTFKQIFDTTPYQYILSKKMKCAIALINSGNESISEISEKLNFPDLPTFSKAFKRKIGVSPIRFQKLK